MSNLETRSNNLRDLSWVTTKNERCLWVLNWLSFLTRPLYLDWYVVYWGLRNTHKNYTCLEEIGLRIQISVTTLHSITGKTYISSLEINKHALPIIIYESSEVRFSIQFLQMFHCRFAKCNTSFCCANLICRS